MKPYFLEILLFASFAVLASSRTIFLLVRRRRLALRFAGVTPDELLFHERGASGFSNNSILCALGTSYRTLEIVITRAELWLRGGPLAQSDESSGKPLLYCIELKAIRSVRKQGKFVEIVFRDKNGEPSGILLRLSDSRGFLEVLNTLVRPYPTSPLRLFRRTPHPAAPVEH